MQCICICTPASSGVLHAPAYRPTQSETPSLHRRARNCVCGACVYRFASLAIICWAVDTNRGTTTFQYGRPIIALSAGLFAVCACGFSCGFELRTESVPPTDTKAREEDAPDAERGSKAAPEEAARRQAFAVTWWLGLPMRWLVGASSSACLFPLASVSYTAYLCQGIAINLLKKHAFTTAELAERLGGVSDWGEFCLDCAVFAVLLLLVVAIGLVVSLLIERPMMNLLYPLARGRWPAGGGSGRAAN